MKNSSGLIKNFIIFFILFIIAAALFTYFTSPQEEDKEIGLSQLVTEINNENVSSITVENNDLLIKLASGEEKEAVKESSDSVSELLSNFGVSPEKIAKVEINVEGESDFDTWILPLLSFILPFLLIIGFIYFMMRGVSGANNKAMMFGQSQARQFAKDTKKKINFKDVAGSREAKEELSEVIEFLKYPKKFYGVGAKIP
ncbi:cell division protein FtsH, partial [Candidatus Falkowbacteria bacterium]|nr:cell division protein FtsH [Candidatus Falkowbacteria bacterium]